MGPQKYKQMAYLFRFLWTNRTSRAPSDNPIDIVKIIKIYLKYNYHTHLQLRNNMSVTSTFSATHIYVHIHLLYKI